MCQLRAVWRDGRWNLEGTARPVVSLCGFVGKQDCSISSSDELETPQMFVLSKLAPGSCRQCLCSVPGHSSVTLLCASWHLWWVWVRNCVHPHSLLLQEKAPLEQGQKTPTPSWTGWQLARVFLRWNSDFDKGVLFVYNDGSTLRISAAAWIPLEDAEEPEHPVSMETRAGGGGCRTTREEQGEAK